MPLKHVALAVLVALVWGYNFVAIRQGLDVYSPLLFSVLRFAMASLPFLPFIGGPQVPWRAVFAIGMVLGVVYFIFLFEGMAMGISPGLTSALVQTQAFFTMGFSLVLLGEKPRLQNIMGSALAFVGVLLIAGNLGADSIFAFILVIGSAICWGYSNILVRKAKAPDALRLMVWVSAVATLPLLALSFLWEGEARIVSGLAATTWTSVWATVYVGLGATIFGFGAWSYLLKRHPAGTVAPYSLLVPVFGLSSSALFLGDKPSMIQLGGVLLIVCGLAVNSLPRGAKAAPSAEQP